MTPSEVMRFLYVLGGVLTALAVGAVALTVVRRALEKRVRELVAQNSDSLVGKRALVVSSIRPSRMGNIRPLGTQDEEADRATARRVDNPAVDRIFPAVSDELISKGRVVRVTGGDEKRYIVRAL